MIAYLSGAMEHVADEGAEWRHEMTIWLKEKLDHQVIDPVVTSQQLVIKHQAQDYRHWKNSDPRRFISFVRKAIDLDLENVMKHADYIICLWNESVLKGGGTHGEITMAYYRGIPVYLVCEMDREELSGWIMSCAEKIFSNFSELKIFLSWKYSGIKKKHN